MSSEARFVEPSATSSASAAPAAAVPVHHHHRPKSSSLVMDSLATVAAQAAAKQEARRLSSASQEDANNNDHAAAATTTTNGKTTTKKPPKKKKVSTPSSAPKKAKAPPPQSTAAAAAATEGNQEKENLVRLEDNDDDPEIIVTTNSLNMEEDADEANAMNIDATTTTTAAATAPKKSAHHNKTYIQLAHDAIVSLNDRSGSSQMAITKYLLQQYPELEQQATFKSRFPNVLKMAVKSQRFVKVKASYKINVEWKKLQVKQKKAAAAEAAKRKKLKRLEQSKKAATAEGATDNEGAATTAAAAEGATDGTITSKVEDLDQPPMTPSEVAAIAKREEQARRKVEEERLKKERAERLRKRRFPMEDTKLHAEDKELKVNPPDNVKKPPILPYFFATTLPLGDARRKGKTPLNTAAKCDAVDTGSRGLVPDLLTVYHFFRGDVHYYQMDDSGGAVPEFTLQQLVYAVQEVLNGNAKRSKLVPPLLSHLFVTCLQILMPYVPPAEKSKNDTTNGNSNHNSSTTGANTSSINVDPIAAAQKQLAKDLSRLSVGLCPASWADICFLYMDTMERYYTSSASNQNYHLPGLDVLPGLHIDSRYLLHVSDTTVEPMTPAKMNESDYLPTGYGGYLGDSRGSLARGHAKLLKQDPWTLTAEELLALLRALVDDVLANSPEISEDIAQRDELMTKLLKEKRAADSHFRKIRFAFEGPKKPPKKVSGTAGGSDENGKDGTDDAERPANGDAAEPKGDDDGKKQAKEWKPTTSKRQFEAAQKAQQKANDAYEKGVRNLVARTEPVGYDRNFNAVYCFRHDPEVLYVEVMRPSSNGGMDGIPEAFQTKRSSWHVIETKSLFDQYVASLDVRGKREYALYDDLMGQPGTQSLRVSLFDDIKERTSASARRKELVDLKRRLENAKIKCDENRHSGRLAGRAVVELSQLEAEMQDLERQIKGMAVPVALNFEELTGLELLRTFDTTEKYKSRGSRSKKESSTGLVRPRMPCSVLWPTGELDGTGVIGSIVTELVVLEERCDALCPVEDQSIRDDWITELEDAVQAWNNSATVVLGTGKTPPVSADGPTVQFVGGSSPSSNRKSDTDSIPAAHRRRSFGSLGSIGSVSDAKRRRLSSSPSSQVSNLNNLSNAQILAMVKKPLLALEDRVFNVTGLAMAASDLDLADANMSDDENEDGRGSQAWKRFVYRLKSISRRHGQVREAVIEAIAAARRAQLGTVVAQLRAALMLHHPSASGACKNAALEVLAKHGGYDPDEDDQDDDDVNADAKKTEETEDACLLAEEAVVMESSLDGNEYAGRVDWIEAVKACKTVSKLASLSCAFVRRASDKLGKLETEKRALQDALNFWTKEEERKQRNRANGKKKVNRQSEEKSFSTTEVWANVRFTEEYCMIKLDADPWWPAKKCEPKEEQLAESLANLNRTLVSLLGEEGALRVVSNGNIQPFTGKTIDEDMKGYSKEVRKQLSEAMAMGRRILRGRQRAGLKTTGLPNGKA